MALYENATPFESQVVDLGDAQSCDAFRKLWPLARFPVLQDEATGRTIPESTSIIEYLEIHYPARVRLIPRDPELAFSARAADRFYDLHVHTPMQRIVDEKLRGPDEKDPTGLGKARQQLRTALGIVEREMSTQPWANGDEFSIADCAAAPPLFFINRMTPLAGGYPNLSAYLDRLTRRPAYARTLAQAQPFLHMFPG
jgi:glutathione S-transferase